MRGLFFLFLSALMAACSCSENGRSSCMRIGVDPSWSPLNFGEMQPYVNGYTEEVLLEVARYNGFDLEKVAANWDTLLEGLRTGQYDAVLTSLPAYGFNQAKYDFSKNYLVFGPVLITSISAHYSGLDQLSGESVGIVQGDMSVLIAQKYPEAMIRSFNSIPELLNALSNGEIEAALLNRLPAVSYVRDLYEGKLKIASEPLSDVGLHLIVPKGKCEELRKSFDKSIARLQKKKRLEELQKKWNL